MNKTIEQPPSADAGLKAAISAGAGAEDFSQFKMADDAGADEGATQITPAASKDDGSTDRSDVDDAANADKTTSQTEPKKQDGTNAEGTASNRTDKKNRLDPRLDQLLTKTKDLEGKLQAAEAKLQEKAKAETKPREVKPLVPQPAKPTYTREVLKQIIAKARAEGNTDLIDNCNEELEKIRDYDLAMVKWEQQNGEATRQHNGAVQHFRQEALKKFPDLAKQGSELEKQYVGIRNGVIAEHFPEILEKPAGEYWVAQVAHWRMQSAQLDAVTSERNQLREEIQKLKKDGLPLESKDKLSIEGKGGEPSSDTDDAAKNLKSALKGLNMGSTMPS